MKTNDNNSDIDSVVMNDDCCRLVFEYLPLKDKCRLERVSQQFKKLVYQKQWLLFVKNDCIPNITNQYNVVDINLFENIIKICQNIKRIDFSDALVNDSVLNVITDSCSTLKAINFSVNDLTLEAIIRFGKKFGPKFEYIYFYYEEESSQDNQQVLLDFCPNLKKLICGNFLSLNVITFPNLKILYLFHCGLWSETDVQTFGRFVDKYQNNIKRFGIFTISDFYSYFNAFLLDIQRFSNLKVFDFYQNTDELLHIQVPNIKILGQNCKKLKKVLLDFTLNDFDLWQTFRYFETLEELQIERFHTHNCGPVLIDSKARIRPLLRLKKFKIRCQSIGDLFFIEITKFAPNLEFLNLIVFDSIYPFSNHSLIALSECRQLKDLYLSFKDIFNIELDDCHVDEIGLGPLLDNCSNLKTITILNSMKSIVNTLTVLLEERDRRSKQPISFNCFTFSEEKGQTLSDLSRLANLERLNITTSSQPIGRASYDNEILLHCDEFMGISVDISCSHYLIGRTDIWEIFCRYKDLKELTFCNPYYDFFNSVSNIEPLIHLKEIAIECSLINIPFFDSITTLAPNLEEFELKSRFELHNGKLNQISRLKKLTKIKLFSTERKGHYVDDHGFIRLLDNCSKLKEVIFNFEVNISIKTIDKLKEMANNRSKERILFQCLVTSVELQSEHLSGLPKNLFIRTNFNV